MGCKEPSTVYIRPIDPNTLKERRVPEGTSCTIKFKLSDPESGSAVPNTAINTAVMRLFVDDANETVIQIGSGESKSDDTDVKSKFDGTGQFKYVLEGKYNKMNADDNYTEEEVHWARFTINFDSGSDLHDYIFNYQIKIENNKFKTST